MKLLKEKKWSPYLVGSFIGMLLCTAIYFMGNALGTSVAFVRMAGILESIFIPIHVATSPYFSKFFSTGAIINWQFALVIFIFFGARFAAHLSKTKTTTNNPTIWKKNFGSNVNKRNLWAFIGGIIIIIGARLAGGCTSGHAISGGSKLAVSSWIFITAMFVSGILVSSLVYKKK